MPQCRGSKLSTAVALVWSLGACSAIPVDETRAIPHAVVPTAATAYAEPAYGTYAPYFTDELRKRYAVLMADALGGADLADYYHFRSKGRAALIGDLRGPDKVASRDLPAPVARTALALRSRLVAALEATARIDAPVAAASAEANFDCWLAELEEGVGLDADTACKRALLAALGELDML